MAIIDQASARYRAALRELRAARIELERTLGADLELNAFHQAMAERVIGLVGTHYGVKSSAIIGKARCRQYAEPRQTAMWLLRKAWNWQLMEIGRVFGCTHVNVIYAVRAVDARMETNRNAHAEISKLLAEIPPEEEAECSC